MVVYVLVYSFMLLLALLELVNKVKVTSEGVDRLRLYIVMIVLVCISGFRDMIAGYDIYVYKSFFYKTSEGINYFDYEVGYYLLNRLISLISQNFSTLLVITSFVTWYFFIKTCLKQKSLSYVLLLLLFCKLYLMGFVYIRQILAVSLACYAIQLYIDKKNRAFLFLVLLSMSFHISASIVLLTPLFYSSRIGVKTMIVIYSLTIILMLSPLKVFVSYLSVYFLGENEFNYNLNYLYIIESMILFSMLLYFSRYFESQEERFYFNLSFVYVALLMVATTNGTFVRLTWYFIYPLLIALSIISKKHSTMIIYIFIVLFGAIYFRTLIIWDGGDFLPYQTIFNETLRPSRWNYLR